jgi:hypothetical protein
LDLEAAPGTSRHYASISNEFFQAGIYTNKNPGYL